MPTETQGAECLFPDQPALAPALASMVGRRVPLVVRDVTQPDQPIVWASPAFLALTGYTEHEVVGRDSRFMQGPETDTAAIAALREAVALGQSASIELVNYRKDGSRFQNLVHLDPVPGHQPPRYYLGIMQDLTGRIAGDAAALATGAAAVAVSEDEDKDLLLRDLRHRTDNALQLILSLLRLRAGHVQEPLAAEALQNAIERIESLVRVQRYLNRLGRQNAVAIKRPLEELAEGLIGAAGEGITLKIDTDPIELPPARVTPVLLFVNEALTNALRHAFKGGRPGEIEVALKQQPTGGYLLQVCDNGTGLPEGMDLRRNTTLGSMLLKAFASQLRGSLDVESSQGGVRLTLRIP